MNWSYLTQAHPIQEQESGSPDSSADALSYQWHLPIKRHAYLARSAFYFTG